MKHDYISKQELIKLNQEMLKALEHERMRFQSLMISYKISICELRIQQPNNDIFKSESGVISQEGLNVIDTLIGTGEYKETRDKLIKLYKSSIEEQE